MTQHTPMEPAASIIRALDLGSDADVARALGVSHSCVRRFGYPKEMGGRDGFIPRRYWPSIKDLGRKRGVIIEDRHFVEAAPVFERRETEREPTLIAAE